MRKDDLGEQLAADYLQKQGYLILARNFTSRLGEIDIIAQKDDFKVFVEVKSRTQSTYGYGREYVTPSKIKKICKTADYYRMKEGNASDCYRFDVMEVDLKTKTIEHFENAFEYCF